jgi:hypothetical protein
VPGQFDGAAVGSVDALSKTLAVSAAPVGNSQNNHPLKTKDSQAK